jgi:hypothetical protein
MDKQPVHDFVNQLVEADFDLGHLQNRLTNFDQSSAPQAPHVFDPLQSFIGFYKQKQVYEDERRDLQSKLDNAKTMYSQAAASLQDMLPANTPLHYDYEGARQELAGKRFRIVKENLPGGQGRIKISSSSRPVSQ